MKRLLLFLATIALLLAQSVNTSTSAWTMTASSGRVKVITASTAGRNTSVYHISGSWDNSSTVSLQYGTGTNCGSSTVTIYGPTGSLYSIALDLPTNPIRIPAGNDFCLNFGSSITGGGGAVYDQRN